VIGIFIYALCDYDIRNGEGIGMRWLSSFDEVARFLNEWLKRVWLKVVW
jgi:hypothetical protein